MSNNNKFDFIVDNILGKELTEEQKKKKEEALDDYHKRLIQKHSDH